MKAILKKINIKKIITIYMLIQPILDVFTSLLVRNISEYLTLGVFVRTIFMVGIAIYSLIICDKKYRTKMLIYYSCVAIYIISFLINIYLQYGFNGIISQIKGVVKTFYLPIILVALIPILKDKNNRIDNKTFVYSLLGYTLVIFLAKVFGVSYSTYDDGYKEGTIGLFYAANEIGAIICCLAPILVLCLLNKNKRTNQNNIDKSGNKTMAKVSIKNNIIYVITLILYIFSILEMGTKAPFFGGIGLSIVTILVCIISFFTINKKEYLIKGSIVIAITLVTLILVPYNPIGMNIEKTNGVSFPKITEFKKSEEEEEKESEITETKETNTSEKTDNQHQNSLINNSLISGRDAFLANNLEIYKNASIQSKLLGIGYMKQDNESLTPLKLVEMDYFDIIICQGIFGFIIYFIPFIILAIIVLKNLFKNIKKAVVKQEIWLMMYSVIDVMSAALLAGHVLTTPASGIYISALIIQLHEKIKELAD